MAPVKVYLTAEPGAVMTQDNTRPTNVPDSSSLGRMLRRAARPTPAARLLTRWFGRQT
jgi:hypothetical protein